MPFGVNSDPSFRALKQIIRVRGCVFSYRRDSNPCVIASLIIGATELYDNDNWKVENGTRNKMLQGLESEKNNARNA